MQTTWIIVADSAIARIFSMNKPGAPWQEIADLTHRESQLHAGDLDSDKSGRSYDSHGQGNHAMEPLHNRKTTEAMVFAREVSHYLTQHEPEYAHLILICAPKFLGQMRAELDKSVKPKITEEIALNVVREKVDKLRSLYADHHTPPH